MVYPLGFMIIIAVVMLVVIHCLHRRESAKFSRECRRALWARHKRYRDDLLETARYMTARGEFRHRRANESPWLYAKAFDRWAAKQLKTQPSVRWGGPYDQTPLPTLPRLPRLPRWPRISQFMEERPDMDVWLSVQLCWWAAEHGGLVHRAVVLRHDHGESFVLRCDHDVLLEPTAVAQFPDGEGPVLTCLHCFGMPRT